MSEADRRNIQTTIVMLLFVLTGFLGAVVFGFVSIDVPGFFSSVAKARTPENDPDYLYARAWTYYEQGDRTMARAVARRATYVNQKHADAYKLLAAIALREKNYNEAAKNCREAIAANPNDVNAQIGLATSLRGMGHVKEAERAFSAIADNPRVGELQRREAHQNLADMLSSRKKQLPPQSAGQP